MDEPHLLGGRYRLDAEIGRGGMARVWRARDMRLDREVAVKTVDLANVSDPVVPARFQREVVVTARLSHPNVVTVFDDGVDDGTAYLVMELLRGETLADLITGSGGLPLEQGLDIACQVVRGLAAAHAVGLVHRDLKPANVMITDGTAKLLDFGIALLSDEAGAGLTQTAKTIGTAAYMSPEQAAGERVGPATDLYAFGCLLMAIFTGSPPFGGLQPIAVAAQQMTGTPPTLSERREGLPPALEILIGRLLDKSAAVRPDATATLAELERIAEDPNRTDLAATAALPVPPVTRVLLGRPVSSATLAAAAPVPTPVPNRVPDPVPDSSFWVAGVLVTLMLAVLAGGLAYSLTAQTLASLPRASSPTPSASRSTAVPPRPTTSAPRPTSPSSKGVNPAVRTALGAVGAALSALPDSKDKTRLVSEWTRTSQQIEKGANPSRQLDSFDKAIDKSNLDFLQKQGIKAAVGFVRSLL